MKPATEPAEQRYKRNVTRMKTIARIAFGPNAPFWDELDAALLRAVDELIGDGTITEETWAVLARELDTQQLLDVIYTVGAYETLAWMMRAFDLDIDDALGDLIRARRPDQQ